MTTHLSTPVRVVWQSNLVSKYKREIKVAYQATPPKISELYETWNASWSHMFLIGWGRIWSLLLENQRQIQKRAALVRANVAVRPKGAMPAALIA